MDIATDESIRPKELISETAQTVFRDSESQYLNSDISNFPRGKGLIYPILYNPAWPVHVAARKKDAKLSLVVKAANVVGSYALKGMTALSETQRRAIKKTLLFPHRNMELPFRQPKRRVVKEPTYERCESLTLQAIEELEPRTMYKSILETMPRYDAKNKTASASAIRKYLLLGPAYVDDPRPPTPRRRKPKRPQPQAQAQGKDIHGTLRNEKCEPVEIIFVDEGQRCGIHGAILDLSDAKNCEIHGDSGIIQEEGKVLEED